ncbi:hypothetical protein [Desulfolucanica intricata]|uniref:hypothetical protein n=1 Tax=Desulfolucanica intricata TaxID=1285191 RepID=UPI00083128D1|nr:hypothetical protein [Desulfolucanica intricata]
MEDKELLKELNIVLTLEHGHLGMYKDFLHHKDKELRRTFRRFAEIEMEHINKIKDVILNLGAKPSPIIKTGDIIGKLFGITINMADTLEALKAYSYIEKKSHQGYSDLVTRLEKDTEKREQFIAEITASNMLESKLMHLWLEDKLKRM